MGLAFVLGCLVIAFAIYLVLKSEGTDAGSNATAANAQVADAATDANTANAFPDGVPDTADSDAADMSPAQPPADGAPAAGAPEADAGKPAADQSADAPQPVPDHQAFSRACVGGAPDGEDKVALCECLYSRLTSYGNVTKRNFQLGLTMCRLERVTDRDRFEHDYAAGDSADGANPGASVPQPQ